MCKNSSIVFVSSVQMSIEPVWFIEQLGWVEFVLLFLLYPKNEKLRVLKSSFDPSLSHNVLGCGYSLFLTDKSLRFSRSNVIPSRVYFPYYLLNHFDEAH